MARDYGPSIDIDLKLRVELALREWSKDQPGRTIERVHVVANKHGEVVLRGRVHSQGVSDEAVQIAQTIPGVRLVFNQIATTRSCWPLVPTKKS
jgi:osmotically-inducible protein OsmY